MDIITHTLTGVAAGTVCASFTGGGFRERVGIVTLGGLAGCLPDVDTISLWSGFDATIGTLFGLEHPGREIYYAKFWYSHHGFMHSLAAGLLIATLIGLLLHLFRTRVFKRERQTIKQSFRQHKWLLGSFVSAYTLHLIEDMPTPACVWDGIDFLWPVGSYIGGTGTIWYWNNYDLFLIVAGVVAVNGGLILCSRWITTKLYKLTLPVFLLGFCLVLFQISQRSINYNYPCQTSQYQVYEQKSKVLQKELLGESLYHFMVKVDNKIVVKF